MLKDPKFMESINAKAEPLEQKTVVAGKENEKAANAMDAAHKKYGIEVGEFSPKYGKAAARINPSPAAANGEAKK